MAKARILEERGYNRNDFLEEDGEEGETYNVKSMNKALRKKGDITESDIEDEVFIILLDHGLQYISTSTAYRWMRYLGFLWSSRRKIYYSDNHEREDVIIERIKYVGEYIEKRSECSVGSKSMTPILTSSVTTYEVDQIRVA